MFAIGVILRKYGFLNLTQFSLHRLPVSGSSCSNRLQICRTMIAKKTPGLFGSGVIVLL